ncbi:carbonic anhydrase family protein [Phototrophicus methaneseepsis]|uniref:carbonic anhydrase n=1 Tax=Phototrophicus methaneseepsis TaxID=2710758 RepID=A0A7S8ED69_9CHLR|nr:carbonic anhydrase family protein [Phototrophicus methaneseepsis]QPC84578.1 carbonic anhydrase family protein [Phototrophicus methaneseepsis]
MSAYGDWDCPLCNTGKMQSPINIIPTETKELGKLEFHYVPEVLKLEDTEFNILMMCSGESTLVYNNQTYTLQQYHFHHPGEHTINGEPYAMELHFVHSNDAGDMLVVAVMLTIGASEHPGYDALWQQLPITGNNASAEDTPLDLSALFPADTAHFYHYIGSLTTPPCTENIQWFILADPVALSQQQVAAYGAYRTGNNRPIQATNARPIYSNTMPNAT